MKCATEFIEGFVLNPDEYDVKTFQTELGKLEGYRHTTISKQGCGSYVVQIDERMVESEGFDMIEYLVLFLKHKLK
jgi:hypothetical protein